MSNTTTAKAKLDQRTDPRIYDAVGIEVFVILSSGFRVEHHFAYETTFDISEGGIRFYDEWGLQDNALLEVRLHTAAREEPLRFYGRVRWRSAVPDKDGFDIGVQFIEAAREDQEAWLKYVFARRNAPQMGMIHVQHLPGL